MKKDFFIIKQQITMLRNFITAVVLIVWTSGLSQEPVYLDYAAPIEDRVEDALQRMTLEEKVKMVHAQSKFSSAGVPRLGIPELWCTDGPHGIRPEVYWDEWNSAEWTNDSCTAFPALTCLAATWRPELAREYGRVQVDQRSPHKTRYIQNDRRKSQEEP